MLGIIYIHTRSEIELNKTNVSWPDLPVRVKTLEMIFTFNSFVASEPPKFRGSPNIFFYQILFLPFFSTPQNQF
jgi:hypothetical protein